jgi:DNA-binding MarR family transcriptional regulator
MSRDSSGTAELAAELSGRWHELGAVLRSRRLHGGAVSGLTPTTLRALAVLEAGGLRVGELAEHMAVEETTATRLVDRLEQAGFAVRSRAADDRRVIVVTLTREGRRLARAAEQQRRRFWEDVLATLEPGERRELVRLTAKAAEAAQAELVAR